MKLLNIERTLNLTIHRLITVFKQDFYTRYQFPNLKKIFKQLFNIKAFVKE